MGRAPDDWGCAVRRFKLRLYPPVLPMLLALAGDDCSGVKTGGATGVSITGVSTTINVTAAATGAAEGAAQGIDPAAGQKGATEYPGLPQHGCLSPPHEKECW